MQFLRAVDQGRFGRAREVATGVPRVAPLANIVGRGGAVERGLWELRLHARESARALLLVEMRVQAAKDPKQPPAVQAARRTQLAVRLARLRPGASTTLRGLRAPDGALAIEPEAKAAVLPDHWTATFAAAPTDPTARDR